MTPEQAVAWLLIEGWRNAHVGEAEEWWFKESDPDAHAVKLVKFKEIEAIWSITAGWSAEDFDSLPEIPLYMHYAPLVVDLILKGETS